MYERLGVWISALAILGMWSQLYKENPFYRTVEHLMIGITAGHAIIMAFQTVRNLALVPIFREGETVQVVVLLLGLMLFLRFWSRLRQYSAIPVAVLVGVGTGIVMRSTVEADFLAQIAATLKPLTSVNNLILLLGVVTTVLYFLFTTRRTGLLGTAATTGRWVMMVAFGAAFGNAVLARATVLISQVQFLLKNWLGLL